MTAAVDLFWSFRSPYSYLATPGAGKREQDFEVEVRFRPVLPSAVHRGDHLAQAAAGHWGVPTFVVEGEPFFGEDRIDTLRRRLGRCGLQRG